MKPLALKTLPLCALGVLLTSCPGGIPSPGLSSITVVSLASGGCDRVVITSPEGGLFGRMMYKKGLTDVQVGEFNISSVPSPNRAALDHDDTYYGVVGPVSGNAKAAFRCFKNEQSREPLVFDRALGLNSSFTLTITNDESVPSGLKLNLLKS